MMKRIKHNRHTLRDLLGIKSHEDFHNFLIRHSVQQMRHECDALRLQDLSVLAICADWKDADGLRQFPFKSIALTGIGVPDERLFNLMQADSRITYERQNAECLNIPSRSFDVVFCKEGLHHLARPVLGLYEMLRICRQAAVFIEGFDGWLNRRLESAGLSSRFEEDSLVNINQRSNYVFRWGRRHLQALLDSYYLDSGWTIQLVSGWMGSRVHFHRHASVRRLAITLGWFLSFFRGLEGNYLTVVIRPGGNLPSEPRPFSK